MANVTTFSHTGAASPTHLSDSLNIRVTWDYSISNGITTFNITKIEIKDDGMQYNGYAGHVELGITVNGVRIIDVSTFQGTAQITSSIGNWSTVTWKGSALTGSAKFSTPSNNSTTMTLSHSTYKQFQYPAVYYSGLGYGHQLTTSLSQTIKVSPKNVVYIDNGTTFDAYEVYIDNGTSWDLYQAYIDNGTSWDECG